MDREAARCTGTCGEVVSMIPAKASPAPLVAGGWVSMNSRTSSEIPSSVASAYSVLTDGLARPVSTWEMRLGDTPTSSARRRRLSPRARRASRSRSPIPAYSGSADAPRRSTPTRPPSLLLAATILPVGCCRRVAPAPRLCSISERCESRRCPVEPAGKDPDEDVRVAGSDDRRLGGAGQSRPAPLVPLRPRQGRARRVATSARCCCSTSTTSATSRAPTSASGRATR